MSRPLAAEDLLAGAQATHRVELPPALLQAQAPGFVTLKPLTKLAAAQNINALTMNRKRPSVMMVTGSVSSTRIGRTTMFSAPSTAAAISAPVRLVTTTPE